VSILVISGSASTNALHALFNALTKTSTSVADNPSRARDFSPTSWLTPFSASYATLTRVAEMEAAVDDGESSSSRIRSAGSTDSSLERGSRRSVSEKPSMFKLVCSMISESRRTSIFSPKLTMYVPTSSRLTDIPCF
jgi:hypothetical protein